jgi:hypothetical protein
MYDKRLTYCMPLKKIIQFEPFCGHCKTNQRRLWPEFILIHTPPISGLKRNNRQRSRMYAKTIMSSKAQLQHENEQRAFIAGCAIPYF